MKCNYIFSQLQFYQYTKGYNFYHETFWSNIHGYELNVIICISKR